jgi:ribosomal protein L16 Arg81 hydroxylase
LIEFGISARDFRARHFEQAPLLCRAALRERPLAWSDLDELLQRIEPQPPAVQLFNRGPIAQDAYTEEVVELGLRRHRLSKMRFYGQLQSGATLVINRFENHAAAARRLCAEVARFVGLQTTSNAYLSFGGRGTFGKHWDTHDVFAIQLIGRKRWQIFAPTLPLPLSHQTSNGAQPASAEPLLDCTLEAGDMLYLPRGWWHQTIPLEEGSLHVSVGAYAPTLYDYLMWVGARMLPQQESARRAFDASYTHGDALEQLTRQLASAALDPRQQAQFQEELAARERVNGEFNLGLFLDPARGGFTAHTKVRLTTRHAPKIEGGETLVNGARLRLDPASEAIVHMLGQHSALDLGALQAKLGDLPEQAFHHALLTLAGHEVIAIEEMPGFSLVGGDKMGELERH